MKLKKRLQITKRGYEILRKYCPGLIEAKVTASILGTLTPFITIWFSARIINEIAGAKSLKKLAIYVLLTVFVNFLFSMIKNSLNKVVAEKETGMWSYFPKIFADKQMSLDYADLEDQGIQKQKQKAEENLFMFGNGLAQLVWDTTGIVEALVGIVASISLTASLFVARTGNSVMDSSLWILAAAVLVIASGLLNAKLRKKEEKAFEKWTEGTVWFNRAFMFFGHELYDNPAKAKDVRIYRQDKIADREMVKLIEHNNEDGKTIDKMSAYPGLLAFAQGLCNVLCYLFVVAKAGLGAFAVGSIVQYVAALSKLVHSFSELVYADSENRVYTTHMARLFDYLDIPSRKNTGTESVGNETHYTLEFRNVSFKYPGSDNYVLKNINAMVTSGKKKALVGANGAGKTTFVKLLCRLYDPTEGEILLNGRDIREYDYKEYMKLFSFVFQDFKLFSLGLGQNIATAENYDLKKVEECIKKVSLGERYKSMAAGAETFLYKDVSEEGVMISGGEAQKIALARALYKDSPIVVLDEPTAALDPIAEAQIYEDFNKLVNNKTAVFVSHRLSSCRFCDEIMVFDKGRIVQTGTHEELLSDKEGRYSELWNAQAKYYNN